MNKSFKVIIFVLVALLAFAAATGVKAQDKGVPMVTEAPVTDKASPNPPQQLSPGHGVVTQSTDVTFKWEESTSYTTGGTDTDTNFSYRLYYGKKADFSDATVVEVNPGSTSKTGMTAGFSIAFLGIVFGAARSKNPKKYLIAMILLGSFVLASGVIGCGGEGTTTTVSSDQTVSYTVHNLETGMAYYWKVEAYNDQGETAESVTRVFYTPSNGM